MRSDDISEVLRVAKLVEETQPVWSGHLKRVCEYASQRERLLKGWNGYGWKDGVYIDSIQEYFDLFELGQEGRKLRDRFSHAQ